MQYLERRGHRATTLRVGGRRGLLGGRNRTEKFFDFAWYGKRIRKLEAISTREFLETTVENEKVVRAARVVHVVHYGDLAPLNIAVAKTVIATKHGLIF